MKKTDPSIVLRAHKTKIVATVGPASSEQPMLENMIRAGLDVARLNFSHGTFDAHGRFIETLRAAARAVGREIAIMADLPGPKMRLGMLKDERAQLTAGDKFTLTTRELVGDSTHASMGFPRLPKVVKPGDTLFLSDGVVQFEVEGVAGDEVRCRVVVGGEIRSRVGVNFPGIDLGISAFTDRDRECLEFALTHGVDAVSQSFVESAADIERVREAARSLGYEPFIIAKIERARALERVSEILAAADGMMIARGDLGVEVPVERIGVIQKSLMKEARRAGKPVITATQMLESMTRSRQPTRAEATDVANAVLDGTDCLMLSGESATGLFPVEAVSMLARIAEVTEPHRSHLELWERMKSLPGELDPDLYDLMTVAVGSLMEFDKIGLVVVMTSTGRMARSLTRFRMPMWIAAVTTNPLVSKHLIFSYGVQAVCPAEPIRDVSAWIRERARAHGLAKPLALLVRGPAPGRPDANTALEVVDLTAS
jgi:pyruvate kinase